MRLVPCRRTPALQHHRRHHRSYSRPHFHSEILQSGPGHVFSPTTPGVFELSFQSLPRPPVHDHQYLPRILPLRPAHILPHFRPVRRPLPHIVQVVCLIVKQFGSFFSPHILPHSPLDPSARVLLLHRLLLAAHQSHGCLASHVFCVLSLPFHVSPAHILRKLSPTLLHRLRLLPDLHLPTHRTQRCRCRLYHQDLHSFLASSLRSLCRRRRRSPTLRVRHISCLSRCGLVTLVARRNPHQY
mmetsp:Transcript_36238/g.59529  ORF Transcript_36238/g.59529 Transcript_36238/m.59529 type:complete len:242 (-) Transcript_36238:344-1069(-)